MGDAKRQPSTQRASRRVHPVACDGNVLRQHVVDPFNRALFVLASYNAGLNRVADLRTLAREQGLDPNVWFNNVELVAARHIGQVTVMYVRNIFKYYVAYKLALGPSESQ